MSRLALLAGSAVALAAVLAGCGESDAGDGNGAEPGADRAPALSAVRLDGDSISLARLEGEVVLLNVWATWCVPCRAEIPELEALHRTHVDDGLHVVGVSVDSRGAEDEVRRFIEEMGMTYDVWWDPDQDAIQAFGAVGVPLTVLIDRSGRVAWRHLGAIERGDPGLARAVEEALGTDPGPS